LKAAKPALSSVTRLALTYWQGQKLAEQSKTTIFFYVAYRRTLELPP
jgi:hypothetical protein